MADSSIGAGGLVSASGTPPHPLNVLIDTNVALDLLLRREPWLTQARPMWDARDAGNLFAYLPASVLTEVFYICRRQVGADQAKRAVEACLHGFTILAVDRALMESALTLLGNDFEDNVQIVCAQSATLDLIVTRNTSDFGHSPIPAVKPLDIVRYLTP